MDMFKHGYRADLVPHHFSLTIKGVQQSVDAIKIGEIVLHPELKTSGNLSAFDQTMWRLSRSGAEYLKGGIGFVRFGADMIQDVIQYLRYYPLVDNDANEIVAMTATDEDYERVFGLHTRWCTMLIDQVAYRYGNAAKYLGAMDQHGYGLGLEAYQFAAAYVRDEWYTIRKRLITPDKLLRRAKDQGDVRTVTVMPYFPNPMEAFVEGAIRSHKPWSIVHYVIAPAGSHEEIITVPYKSHPSATVDRLDEQYGSQKVWYYDHEWDMGLKLQALAREQMYSPTGSIHKVQ